MQHSHDHSKEYYGEKDARLHIRYNAVDVDFRQFTIRIFVHEIDVVFHYGIRECQLRMVSSDGPIRNESTSAAPASTKSIDKGNCW